MSAAPQDILNAFDVLPPPYQRLVAVEIARRAARWDYGELTDDELCPQADALFKALDEAEVQFAALESRETRELARKEKQKG